MVTTPTITVITTPIIRTTIIIGTAGTIGINAQFLSAAIAVAASGDVLV
jgi:hypothetical protein